MYKLFVFVVVALVVSETMGFRVKRQSGNAANPVQPVVPRTSTTASTPTAAAPTTLSPETEQCIRDCPVTAEYNPVCGTNRVLYANPGRLLCAQACGVKPPLLYGTINAINGLLSGWSSHLNHPWNQCPEINFRDSEAVNLAASTSTWTQHCRLPIK